MVLLEGSRELGDDSGYFDSAQEDPFLSLELDVFGPPDESGEVALRLDVIARPEVPGSLLEKRVRLLLDLLHASFSLAAFALGLRSTYHEFSGLR